MKINLSFVLIVIIANLLSVTSASAFSLNIFSNKINAKKCPNRESAIACSNCSDTEVYYEFEINENKSIVIMRQFKNDKLAASSALTKCKVVDKKNWSCGEGKSSELSDAQIGVISFTNDVQAMNEGIYYQISEMSSTAIADGKNRKNSFSLVNIKNYTCAK